MPYDRSQMSKTVRGILLVIAAILGLTQLGIVYKYIDVQAFSSPLFGIAPLIAVALLVPAAICGVLAASLINNTKASRLFAALAAGITALTVLIPVIFYFRLYAGFDTPFAENARLSLTNLNYELGFFTSDEFITPNWLQILGTIALILWLICAAFPDKKGSEPSLGMPAFVDPNAMSNNPVTSYAPAPVTSAPVVPAATQGAKFCTNCGKPLVGAAKFCAECGTPV